MAVSANDPLKASIWMMGALVSFTLIGISGREVSSHLDTAQVMFLRSVIGVMIVVAILILRRRGFASLKTDRFRTHLFRNLFHFVGQYGWLFGVASLVPLAEVFAIEFTAPLWVAVFAPFFLGEKLNKWRVLAISLGFVGILVVARPGFVEVTPGMMAVVIAAMGFAGSMIMTKKLTTTEAPVAILFYMSLLQTPIALVAGGGDVALPTGSGWFWVIMISVCGLTAHYSMAKAFSYGDATLVVTMDFFRLPLIAIVAALVYAEPITIWVVIGGGLILVANYVNVKSATPGTAAIRGKR
jgi:drug/metabolite transporter (DMT)-like permease